MATLGSLIRDFVLAFPPDPIVPLGRQVSDFVLAYPPDPIAPLGPAVSGFIQELRDGGSDIAAAGAADWQL